MRRGRKIAVAILTALMVLVAGAGAAFGVLARAGRQALGDGAAAGELVA